VRFPSGPCVYLVQLLPELEPRRLKVGYSQDVGDRLRIYRCSCPSAQVIAVGEGDRGIEGTVLRGFVVNFKRIGGEVFWVNDVDEAVGRFVALLAHAKERRL
jgi:hypothetical protein